MAATESGHLTPFRAAALAGPLGLAMLLGGPDRVSGPSFTTVAQYGGEVTWGLGFLGIAFALIVSRKRRLLFHAYVTAATGYGLFVVAFITAAATNPAGALTGIVAYSWIIWLHTDAAAAASTGRVVRALRRFGALLARRLTASRG